MMNAIIENQRVSDLTTMFRRAPHQLNQMHESDAEIIRLANGEGPLIALTTDCLSEELATGLYREPSLMGWMAVMCSLSDLAAVGADPLGLVISETLPPTLDSTALRELQNGMQEACTAGGTWILGGDTNEGSELAISACALGTLPAERYLTRIGCSPGDVLYASSSLGRGNAYAYQHFFDDTGISIRYRPRARVSEGRVLREFGSSCMDTSDGVLATLDQLMRLNTVGFSLNAEWEALLDEEARRFFASRALPFWLLLAGPHGEFELLFTIAQYREHAFTNAARQIGWIPQRLGTVIEEPSVVVPVYGESLPLASGWMRNLFADGTRSLEEKFEQLLQYDHELQEGVHCHVNA